jgi:predicted acetyltransferase
MAIEIRPVGSDEVDALLRADEFGFSGTPHLPEESRSWATGELDRTRCAFENGQMVGVSRAYSFELTLPGGTFVPAAALSWVSVRPTHRRRGILTRMIDALHRDARDRGEPAGILTASESLIYQRYGYGISTWRLSFHAHRSRVHFRDDAPAGGSVRLLDRAEAESVLPALYDRLRRERAGRVTRPDFWWPSVFWDYIAAPKKAFFIAVHSDEHGVDDGFAGYEVSGDWLGGLPDRDVVIWDLQADCATTRIALWRYLFSVDLTEKVSIKAAPVDDPLRHAITDPRRIRIDAKNDELYVAPLDPQRLLGTRSYATDGHVVIEVHMPDGARQTLSVESKKGETQCEATDSAPELGCRADVLGMAMLGGNRWSELAGAGRVDVRSPDALATADLMFGATPAPALLSAF